MHNATNTRHIFALNIVLQNFVIHIEMEQMQLNNYLKVPWEEAYIYVTQDAKMKDWLNL